MFDVVVLVVFYDCFIEGEIGSEPTCNWVPGASECKWCDAGSSREDCCVSIESEVPSTGSGQRDGGRDCVMRLGTIMAAKGCLLRCSL